MNKYIRAVIINILYFGISSLFFLIITPVALHSMGEDFFGLWSILNAILVFSGVGNLGIGVVVNKFASEKSGTATDKSEIITASTLILIPMAILCCVILILVRAWIIPKMDISQALREDFSQSILIISFCLIPQFLSQVPYGYILSQLKNGLSGFIELAVHITSWVGAIILAITTHDLKMMALWLLIVQVLTMLYLYYSIFRMIGYRLKFNLDVFKRITKFSSFTFLGSLANAIFLQLDRVLVGFMLGPAAAGAYTVGTSVGLRLSMITGQVTEVMVPYASFKQTNNDDTSLFENFRSLSRLINIALAVLGGLLIIWMKEILTLWISAEYAGNYSGVFSLLILAYMTLSLSRPGHQTLTGIGHVRFSARIYILMSLLTIMGIYWLSPLYGLNGAAAAKLFSILLLSMNLYVYYLLKGRISIKYFLEDNGLAITFTFAGYLLILLNATVIMRIMFSIIIITFTLISLLTNRFIKVKTRIMLKKIFMIMRFKNSE